MEPGVAAPEPRAESGRIQELRPLRHLAPLQVNVFLPQLIDLILNDRFPGRILLPVR
jgi:hypothetical protein